MPARKIEYLDFYEINLLTRTLLKDLQDICDSNYKMIFDKFALKSVQEYIFDIKQIYSQMAEKCSPTYKINSKNQDINYIPTTGYSKKLTLDFVQHQMDKIFQVEEECNKVVRKIWQQEITSPLNFEEGSQFKLVIKMLTDWIPNFENSELKNHREKRISSSYTLIANGDLRTFDVNNSTYGFIAQVNDGFMGAYKSNAFLNERINGENPNETIKLKIGNKRIYNNNGHEVFADIETSTVITPSSLLKNTFMYNEVILDTTKSKNAAVFYFSYGNKFLSKDYEKAALLSEKLNLPLKEIKVFDLDKSIIQSNLPNKEFLIKEDFKKKAKHYGHGFKQLEESVCHIIKQINSDVIISKEENFKLACLIVAKNPITLHQTKQIAKQYLLKNQKNKTNEITNLKQEQFEI